MNTLAKIQVFWTATIHIDALDMFLEYLSCMFVKDNIICSVS